MVNIDRYSACSFTGHRAIPNEIRNYLLGRVKDAVNYLYPRGIKTYLTGGAIGFDTLAAMAVIKCREVYKDIRLILVIPCRDQARTWTPHDVVVYENIKQLADEVVCLSEYYYNGCMHARNRYLIDNSDSCVCYLTRASGGTAYTIRYARERGLSVYNLAHRGKAAP